MSHSDRSWHWKLTQNKPSKFHGNEKDQAYVVAIGRASAMSAVLERCGHVDDDCEQDEQQKSAETELPKGHERLTRTFANEKNTDYD